MALALPSDSIQEMAIGVAFNASMLNNLLAGIYTVVYLGTLYIYQSKKSSKSWLVIGSISLSYIAYMVTIGVAWYLNKIALVDNGTSRKATFVAIFASPIWLIYVETVCSFLIAAVGDGLLIWRGFSICDRSFRAVSLPSFLLFWEIALDLSILIFVPVTKFNPSMRQAYIIDALNAASLFTTLLTTLASTTLIVHRIHLVSKQHVLHGLRTRFNHILDLLVQSALPYSLVSFAYAIPGVIPFTANNSETLNASEIYLKGFYYFIAGIAPTIMIARVALASGDSGDISAVTHISGLQFRFTTPKITQFRRDSKFPGNNGDSDTLSGPKELYEKRRGTLQDA